MSRILRLTIVFVLLMALIPVSSAQANQLSATIPNCVPFNNPNNEIEVYLICLPPDMAAWKGDLIVFAHGYVDPRRPVDIPYDELVLSDGTTIPGLVNSLNFAFATTSYRKNGLSVLEGVQDILGLIDFFKLNFTTNKVFLIGASEGGLVTTLVSEQYPASINGGLALCGPVGDFVKQVNYWDDFRVVFDYFFPGKLAPTAINIPATLPDQWSSYTTGSIGPFPNVPIEIPGPLQKKIKAAIYSASPSTLSQLLKVTKAPKIALNPVNSTWFTVRDLLWYNIMSTNEGRMELNHGPYTDNLGNPFNNKSPLRRYTGSRNDTLLNARVKRYAADPAALIEMAKYQTSGILTIPMVNMHTTLDPIVPFWHQTLYVNKVRAQGYSANLTFINIGRYGHCSFYAEEMLLAFNALLTNAGGPTMADYLAALPDQASRDRFTALVQKPGSVTSATVSDK